MVIDYWSLGARQKEILNCGFERASSLLIIGSTEINRYELLSKYRAPK
jgi:hypothetical protein